MAISKALIATVLVSILIIHLAEGDQKANDNSSQGSPPTKIGASAARCQLSSRPNLCKRAFGTCCARCNCVPPGTSGSLEVCLCYANMTTCGSRGKSP